MYNNRYINNSLNMTLIYSIILISLLFITIVVALPIMYIFFQLYAIIFYNFKDIHQICDECYGYEIISFALITNSIRILSYQYYRYNDVGILNIFICIAILQQLLFVPCINDVPIINNLIIEFILNMLIISMCVERLF